MEEVKELEKRPELLDSILNYYNTETKTFDIPKNWKSKNVRRNKLPADNPRDYVFNKIEEVLSFEEMDQLISDSHMRMDKKLT